MAWDAGVAIQLDFIWQQEQPRFQLKNAIGKGRLHVHVNFQHWTIDPVEYLPSSGPKVARKPN